MKYLGDVIGSMVVTIAILCCMGYMLGIEQLVAVVPGYVPMKMWTVFGLMLAGIHCMLSAQYRRTSIKDGPAFAIGLWLMLLQIALISAAIIVLFCGHRFPFNKPGYTMHSLFQVPSLITAINLGIYGFIAVKPKYRVTGSYIMIWTGLRALIGYALHIPEMYFQWQSNMTPVAVNTAFCLLLLGIYIRSTVKCTVTKIWFIER